MEQFELLLHIIKDNLIIDRVVIPNRWCGLFTNLFICIADWCRDNKILNFIVSSVLTWDVFCWCYKNGFEPRIGYGAGFNELPEFDNPKVIHNGEAGDYIYKIRYYNEDDITINGLTVEKVVEEGIKDRGSLIIPKRWERFVRPSIDDIMENCSAKAVFFLLETMRKL